MKSILNVLAVCAVVSLAACSSNKTVSPGAVGSEKNGCCTEKASCTDKKDGTSMGAVSEKKSGCCAEKAAVSPGAVGEKKSGCCASSAAKKVDG